MALPTLPPGMRPAVARLPPVLAAALLAAAPAPDAPGTPAPAYAAQPLPNGMALRRGEVVISVTALSDGVLRIRIGRHGALPEDASWAVLPAARAAATAVRPAPAAGPPGFATASLAVAADPRTGALTVRDSDGAVLLADVAGAPFLPGPGDGFRLEKQLTADEHIFGLGDKAGPLDRRGHAYTLWNSDAYRFQAATDPLYKSIPFYTGYRDGRAYGLLLDNPGRTAFDFGVAAADRVGIAAAGGAIDYYVLAGPSPRDVQREYGFLTGNAPLPPLWALGYQQSRYSYMSATEIRAVAARLRRDRIPADVLWFDIDVQDRNRPFTVDAAAFPDFPGLVAALARQGFRAVVITDLHIARAPGQDYAPYDSGAAGRHFVRAPDGRDYVGTVWPGPAVFPDFFNEAARAWWGTLYRGPYLGSGVAGFWNDMNEPSVFDTPTHTLPDGVLHRIDEPGRAAAEVPHAAVHNAYGMENARATYEGLLRLRPDRRPFVMWRAGYAGAQRYGVTWTGDNSSTWDHLRLSTPMLESLGASGIPYAGDDIGGFCGSHTPDLLTRWFEIGMFNPIARDHSEKGTAPQEPWADGPRHEAIRRRYVEERYRLLPYLYALADETTRDNMPLMRPLFMEFPGGAPLDLAAGGAFMLGPALLVAPAPYPEAPDAYDVPLPPGGWYDYWTGRRLAAAGGAAGTRIAGPARVHVTPRLDRLPVFVRAGSIIPRQPLVQSTAETPRGPLQIAVYPGPGCAGVVYADDGVSLAYTRGGYRRTRLRCTLDGAGGLTVAVAPPEGHYTPWWTETEFVIHGISGPRAARYDGRALGGTRFDAAAQALRVTVPGALAAGTLSIAPPPPAAAPHPARR